MAATRIKRPEQALHIQVAQFMRVALPPEIVWLHVPNGGKRTRAEAALFKVMGQLPGAADLLVILPGGQCGWIELKARAGVVSDAQHEFGHRVKALGCGHQVCRTIEEVEATLARWLKLKGLALRASILPSGVVDRRPAQKVAA